MFGVIHINSLEHLSWSSSDPSSLSREMRERCSSWELGSRMGPDSASVVFSEKIIQIFHLEMELGSARKGGGIPVNGKKGRFSTQFLGDLELF